MGIVVHKLVRTRTENPILLSIVLSGYFPLVPRVIDLLVFNNISAVVFSVTIKYKFDSISLIGSIIIIYFISMVSELHNFLVNLQIILHDTSSKPLIIIKETPPISH